MRLPLFFYFFRRGDILGILAAVLFLAFVLFVPMKYPHQDQETQAWKVGSDWSCQPIANSGPICIKDVLKRPAK